MNISWRLVVNFILFQLGWFSCLMISSHWLFVIVGLIILIHFVVVVPKLTPKHDRYLEAIFLTKVVLLGALLELAYLWFGLLVREDASLLPPLWLLFIWLLFATTVRHSLFWMHNRLPLAAAFAAVAAPLSYYAGANLNEMVSLHPNVLFSLSVIAISWAAVFPCMLYMASPKTSSV